MLLLIFGLVLFFAVHSLSIVNEPYRDNLVSKLSAGSFKTIYSLISLLGLILIAWGYGLARYDPILIWTPPLWLRHLSLLLMLPVFILLTATYFPGKIKRIVKHPMLIAVKLWALSHLLANGMLADLFLFGSFLTWAVLDRISLKNRPVRTSPSLPEGRYNDLIAIAAGLLIYVVFAMWLHLWLIGVSPVAVGS